MDCAKFNKGTADNDNVSLFRPILSAIGSYNNNFAKSEAVYYQ